MSDGSEVPQEPNIASGSAAPRSTPSYEALLLHPIFEEDVSTNPAESYDDWPVDHSSARRFYVIGGRWVQAKIKKYDASFYHKLVERAQTYIAQQTDWTKIGGDWQTLPSYSQIRRANNGGVMTFDRAAFAVAAYAVAYEDWCKAELLRDPTATVDPLDVYEHIWLLPTCFNIDGLNPDTLKVLLQAHSTADAVASAAAGQKEAGLLAQVAAGRCVTLRTARALLASITATIGAEPGTLKVGPVCGRPGSRVRGRGPASDLEKVDLFRPEHYRLLTPGA